MIVKKLINEKILNGLDEKDSSLSDNQSIDFNSEESNKIEIRNPGLVTKKSNNLTVIQEQNKRQTQSHYEIPVVESLKCKCKKIQVVDDETFNIDTIKVMLKKDNIFEILAAYNGEQGQETVKNLYSNKCVAGKNCKQVTCVLMDYNMPVMGGIDCTRSIFGYLDSVKHRRVPVFALTAYIEPEKKKECFNVGMNEFINKPINFKRLKDLLARYDAASDL